MSLLHCHIVSCAKGKDKKMSKKFNKHDEIVASEFYIFFVNVRMINKVSISYIYIFRIFLLVM